jgi:hypothetical protein
MQMRERTKKLYTRSRTLDNFANRRHHLIVLLHRRQPASPVSCICARIVPSLRLPLACDLPSRAVAYLR